MLNFEKLAQRNSSKDLLKAFLIKEVEFRIDSEFVYVPKSIKGKALAKLVNDLAEDLNDNSDIVFNYDKIDNYLQTQINEIYDIVERVQ